MIYLIDDDASVRKIFEFYLNSEGREYKSLCSAEDFLSIYQPSQNNIVILDLNMPGMSGCELLEKLRDDKIQLPVIVVTAYDEPEYRECCKRCGAIAYLLKPVHGKVLMELINYNLDENKSTLAKSKSYVSIY